MGCCSSRPVDDADHDRPTSQPQNRRSATQAITSQTAINPSRQQPAPLEPPSTTSLHHSETSRSATSTPRRRRSQPQVSLAEHYNLPLQAPKPWTSKDRTWTRAQLQRERVEFFETRVTGRKEVWAALRQVCESVRDRDIPTAQGILDAVGVTLPTGRLDEGGYDEAGNLYRMPNTILSDPTNVRAEGEGDEATVVGVQDGDSKEGKAIDDQEPEKEKEIRIDEKGKAVVDKNAMRVRCRLSDRGGPDVVVMLGRKQTVSALAQRVKDEGQLPSSAKVRIAYLGHMLDDKKHLTDQGWKEGHVVNALVSGVYS